MNIGIKYERGFIKPDKNSLILLGIVLVLAILVGIGLFYYFSKESGITEPEAIQKEGISEEVLKQFRAPNDKGTDVPEETLEQFGAIGDGEEIPEDVLEQFRAPK